MEQLDLEKEGSSKAVRRWISSMTEICPSSSIVFCIFNRNGAVDQRHKWLNTPNFQVDASSLHLTPAPSQTASDRP